MGLPLIVWGLGLLGSALLGGCGNEEGRTEVSPGDDTWQPKPDAGGMDDDAHGATDRDYYAPDGGVSPDAGPADDIQEPDTEGPQELVDNDGDGVLGCVSESNYTGNQPYSDFKKICDCNDNNKYIKPATAAEYVAQGLVSFDTNCNGNTEVNVNKDAVKFVGESPNDKVGGQNIALGDVNHDGYADVIIAAAAHTSSNNEDVGVEGKVSIFFGGPNKFKAGQLYNLADADVTLIGGAGWYLGGSLAAVPVGDTNGDGRVNESDECDLFVSAHPNNGEFGGAFGDGNGNANDGKAAVLYVKGRQNWLSKYAFYDVPGMNDEHIVDGHNAASLTQNQMGIIKSQADGFNISWGPAFGKHVNEGKRDVMLGETNSAQLHLIPAQEYLGINWLEDLRTTWVKDFNFSSNISAKGAHHLADITADGRADLVLSDSENDSNGATLNGRVTIIKGQQSVPEEVILPANNGPVANGDGGLLPFMTLSGAQSNDLVGTGVVVDQLDNIDGFDLAIGALNQSGSNDQSGCIPVLFSGQFQPEFTGMNISLNADLPNYGGVVIHGDAENAYITEGGALQSFNPNAGSHHTLIFGAPNHPENPRVYVGDMSMVQGMNQFQISASLLPQVTGPNSFGSWFSNGADVNGSGAESVLVGAPKAENNKGAAYLFVGVPEMSL